MCVVATFPGTVLFPLLYSQVIFFKLLIFFLLLLTFLAILICCDKIILFCFCPCKLYITKKKTNIFFGFLNKYIDCPLLSAVL